MTDEWIKHDGDQIPVGMNTLVFVKFADGSVAQPMPAGFWDAQPSNWKSGNEIVAYRIVKEAEGDA